MKSWWFICLLLTVLLAFPGCAAERLDRSEYWQQLFETEGQAEDFEAILNNMEERRFEGEKVVDLVAALDAIALKRSQMLERQPRAEDFIAAAYITTNAAGCISERHKEWAGYRPYIIQNADSDPSVHERIAWRVSDDLLAMSVDNIEETLETTPIYEYVDLRPYPKSSP